MFANWPKSLLLGLAATAWSLAAAPVRADLGGPTTFDPVDAWLDAGDELSNPASPPLVSNTYPVLPATSPTDSAALHYPPALRGATTFVEPTYGGASDGRPAGSPLVDASVAPAQASQPSVLLNLAPTRAGRTPAVNRRPTSLVAGGVAAGTLASVPYMIGDTGAGTCIGFDGVLDAEISHPTLSCGRLNIAENNSPLPANRFYMSYRHFENATPISVYQFREEYNIDRWTLANESTFWGGLASWEIRLPIAYQVPRNMISVFDDDTGAADLIADPNREADLGNLSLIVKFLMLQGSDYAVSAGLGITVPTARDVRYRLAFDGTVVYPDFPGVTFESLTAIDAQFDNETVYLAPFLSWLYAPQQSRWFHHGFLQIETAANPSTVTGTAIGTNTFLFNGVPFGFFDYVTGPGPFAPSPVDVELHSQTLMRLNLGTGYELAHNPRGTFVQRLVGLAELHYTTTLQDAKLSEFPTTDFAFNAPTDFQDLRIGNLANRVDILNAALGLQADVGRFVVTNGFVAPLRETPDRGFDFEYNLQVQLPY